MSKKAEKLMASMQANIQQHATATYSPSVDLGREHVKIRVDLIDPNPYQPRKLFDEDELKQLAMSIAETGLIQPINVRQVGDRYQLIAGERRLRAHQMLAKHSIEAIVQEAGDAEMAVCALAENIDRADLSDFEIGKALHDVEKLFPTKTKLAECLGFGREDLYKFFAFDVLPAFIIEKLDANPRLISRRAAGDIKAMLTRTNAAPEVLSALHQAIELVEQKELDQLKIIDFVNRATRGEPMRASATATEFRDAKGKKVGSIRHDGRNVVFTVRENVLTPSQQQSIQSFIERLVYPESKH